MRIDDDEKRRHRQMRSFFDAVASSGPPTQADLDAEGIPARHHRAIRIAVDEIRGLRASGEMGAARRQAREYAGLFASKIEDLEPPTLPSPRDLVRDVGRI